MKQSFPHLSCCIFIGVLMPHAHARTPDFTTVFLPGRIADVSDIAMGDLNNDGKMDVVTASRYKLYWHRNLGNRKFAKPVGIFDSSTTNSIIHRVKVADMDGDGHLDLVVSCLGTFAEESGLYVYPGKGNGSFGKRHEWYLWGGGSAYDISIDDMNGDRHPDVTMVQRSYSKPYGVVVSFNDGTGREDRTESYWSQSKDSRLVDHLTPIPRPRHAQRVVVGDLDDDGDPDVLLGSTIFYASSAFADIGSLSVGYGGVDAMRNNGLGRFKVNAFYPIATNKVFNFTLGDEPLRSPDDRIVVNEISIANVNRVGARDVIAAMEYNTIHTTGASRYDRTHFGVYWWPNKGGVFQDTAQGDRKLLASKSGHEAVSFVASDFDRDGDDDVVAVFRSLSDTKYEIQYLENHGAGDFKLANTKGILKAGKTRIVDVKDITTGDLDGDGDLDLVAGGSYMANGTRVYGNWIWYNEAIVTKDVAVPQIIITGPGLYMKLPRSKMIMAKGLAFDNRNLARWEYRLNGGAWKQGGKLSGVSGEWFKNMGMVKIGTNRLETRAFDLAGNVSPVATRMLEMR